jgi:hypothetical protein
MASPENEDAAIAGGAVVANEPGGFDAKYTNGQQDAQLLATVPIEFGWNTERVYLPAVGTPEARLLTLIIERGEDGRTKASDVGLARDQVKFLALINRLGSLGWEMIFCDSKSNGAPEVASIELHSDKLRTWWIKNVTTNYKVEDWCAAVRSHTLDGAPIDCHLQSLGELLAQQEPTKWLVRDFLECDTAACLYGASGHGKSFVAVDIACSVAAGMPWHGHEAKQGSVVYFCGEGHAGIGRRFKAWSIARGVKDLPIVVSNKAINLQERPRRVVEFILTATGGVRPALIVVDTLVRHLPPGSDENSGADVAPMLAALDGIGRMLCATTLIVHHVGHAATERERGWSGIRAAMDASFLVTKGAGGPIVIKCTKAKDHAEPDPMQFALRQVELPLCEGQARPDVSAVLEPAAAAPAIAGKNQGIALDALRALLDASNGAPVPVSTWRKESGLTRQRWHEAFAALTASAAVIVDDDFATIGSDPP